MLKPSISESRGGALTAGQQAVQLHGPRQKERLPQVTESSCSVRVQIQHSKPERSKV